MADKEPRRRKKNRRESQKKDDVRSEDQFIIPPKPEPRDSDQEVEEEPVIHGSHQPSNLAKFVFVILFSGLVVSLSVIFISLRDIKDDQVDILDMGHDDHHGEALHDEHIEDALHDDHDEHDEHEESEVRFEDILPSLSSILSLNNEQVQDTEKPVLSSEDTDKVTDDKEEDVITYTTEPEVSTDQGILEEYIEDTSEPPDSIEEPATTIVYPDASASIPYTEDESVFTSYDYSEVEDFPAPSVQPDEVETLSETTDIYDDIPPATDDTDEDDNDQDSFSLYERADITNEADFEIREQLDEIDDMVARESNDDDDDDDDDDDNEDDNNNEDDDEEEEEDEGVEEEFDFWQF